MILNLRLSSITLFVVAVHAIMIIWALLVVPKAVLPAKKGKVVVQTVNLQPKSKARAESKVSLPTGDYEPVEIESLPRLEKTKTVEAAKVTIKPKEAAKPKEATKAVIKPKETTTKATVKPKSKKIEKKSTVQPDKKIVQPARKVEKAKTVKNQEFLAKAQESIAKIRPSGVKIDAKSKDLPVPSLNFTEESGSWSEGELGYREELAARLKLQLVLPEVGSVALKLTLKRDGSVSKVVIVKAASQRNRQYIESEMPNLSFPPFGSHFKNETEHTFTISLNNDF